MLNLNQSSINSANNASQFDAGNVLAREAEKVYAEGLEKMQAPFDAGKMTERQREIMTARLDPNECVRACLLPPSKSAPSAQSWKHPLWQTAPAFEAVPGLQCENA